MKDIKYFADGRVETIDLSSTSNFAVTKETTKTKEVRRKSNKQNKT